MLPQRQINGDVFAIPKFDLVKKDVNSFMEKLRGLHQDFHDCFQRSEPRENFFHYMVGQFSDLKRKSAEPIALNVEDGNIRGIQRVLSDVHWDEPKMKFKYRSKINEDLGDENGVMIFDESGFPKKGNKSVGVARQYCGATGKVDNCQVGVFSAYASQHGYALLDKRLFMPEKWFGEKYKKRRTKCKVPKDLKFKTKPQLASEMLEEIDQEASVPFKYVVADTVYGDNPGFVKTIESIQKAVYFLSISCNTLCWLKEPMLVKKEYKYKGEKRVKSVLLNKDKKPIRVDKLAQNINDYFWYRRKVSEGTKGPIEYEFTKREIVVSRKELPDKRVWLIVKRTLDENPTYSYYISNAPKSTRLKTFVWLSGVRWAIEQCFEEGKTELGMDQYEVRKYTGWNHHMLSCMLAHFFLWHLRITLGKKSAVYYSVAA